MIRPLPRTRGGSLAAFVGAAITGSSSWRREEPVAGHHVRVSHTIPAQIERVWDVLTDIDRAAHILTGVAAIERVDDGPYTVGTRWRETRKVLGKAETEEMWVAEVEPPVRTVVRSAGAGVDYVTTFTLRPDDAGTTVEMMFGADTPDPSRVQKALWRTFGALGRRVTQKMMERDLRDIARAATAMR
jgi:carbon monoxide dehydrogenase subunit G